MPTITIESAEYQSAKKRLSFQVRIRLAEAETFKNFSRLFLSLVQRGSQIADKPVRGVVRFGARVRFGSRTARETVVKFSMAFAAGGTDDLEAVIHYLEPVEVSGSGSRHRSRYLPVVRSRITVVRSANKAKS